ncbi:phosphoribosylglycinamide formyltransferase [Pedomonas mirosovicensis]|uniref:phosphoribosylglycinamide formyltransferase n=1 Tax=Pedomonas mirosovicensis TaxID=2908641 RepID=UPI00216974A0|nr:phosphoribosylglycinamide formyltransferase [Pedomonas mirosovicensis]MCH8685302.1 phosphoribosylglycinamide formyltransferase [Pedomonas mirosovicensis]
MTRKLRIGVLISGRGSNFKALLDATQQPDFPAEIVCVISNKGQAGGLEYARAAGIPAIVISHTGFASREAFDITVDDQLRRHQVDIVCLAGFMRVLSAEFINRWPDRILNIHPSLLPAFRGLHTHEKTLEAGCKIAGCTVHIVRPALDEGPILAQAAVPVLEGDSPGTLAARILEQEHRIYPEAVRLIAEGRVEIDGMVARIRDSAPTAQPLVNPAPRG